MVRDPGARLKRLPPAVLDILLRAGKLADRRGERVFAVGGFVRDLFLGKDNYDIDLVVEGDGQEYARCLSEEMGARLVAFGRFGTARLCLPGGGKVDVATARRESYPRAAVLPVVEFAGLQEDLGRRDFTINAMAIALNGDTFGKLVDYYGGRRDLEARTIRALHPLSFVDDPTRVFRAVRFEQRYGYALEPDTMELARQAVTLGMLARVSRDRLRNELILVLGEPEPYRALRRLDELGAMDYLLGESKREAFDASTLAALRRGPAALAMARRYLGPNSVVGWLVYLILLLHRLEPDKAAAFLDSWAFPRRATTRTLFSCREWPVTLAFLEKASPVRGRSLWEILEPWPPEGLAALAALSATRRAVQRIRRFWERISRIRLLISGEDLQRMGYRPGPDFKEALREVLKAKIDGRVQGRERELTQAARYLEKKRGTCRDERGGNDLPPAGPAGSHRRA